MRKIKVGDVFTTNKCGDCVVIEYVNFTKVKVKFITTGCETWCRGHHLRKGEVRDLYYPSVCGAGYLGEGGYISKLNGKHTKEYKLWNAMLTRCYNVKFKHYRRYSGRGVTICKEWHNFQNFAAWVVEQPNYNKEGFQLDKDLRVLDSKEYSPNTCSFVPQNINTLLTANNSGRGEYPIGVYYQQATKKYQAYCSNGKGKHVTLGRYQTQEQAFQAYKSYKESLIKQVALEEYNKGNIIEEVYNNLMKYEVVPYPE